MLLMDPAAEPAWGFFIVILYLRRTVVMNWVIDQCFRSLLTKKSSLPMIYGGILHYYFLPYLPHV